MLCINAGSLLVEGGLRLVELTGMFPCAGGVTMLVKTGGTQFPTGKADISSAGRFKLKGW